MKKLICAALLGSALIAAVPTSAFALDCPDGSIPANARPRPNQIIGDDICIGTGWVTHSWWDVARNWWAGWW